MSTQIFSENDAYKFLKVEEYFDRYKEWEKLVEAKSHTFDANTKTLVLNFDNNKGQPCSIIIQFPQKDTFRLRFNPSKAAQDYAKGNSRSVMLDTFEDLTRLLDNHEHFNMDVKDLGNRIELITKSIENKPEMKVVVNHKPFSITVYMFAPHEEYIVWQTADTPIYYTPNGDNDYAIIQSVKKPANGKYVGFGEQGGQSLSKNTAQINYFNFDNMRYRQIYDRGPLDPREPMYHSEPFFYEFHGVPEHDSVTAIFIDNTGQVLVDIGYINSNRYMFGTRFGDLDFYFFIGHNPANILDSYTEIVGRARLKPRYCLGYHQGCYGYDRQDIVEWAVRKHREYQIPLDGMHVDVDVQNNYQTFTIDLHKFPDPYTMFHRLKEQGVKCSTNITPVISRLAPGSYSTYDEAKEKGYFVLDRRYDPENPESKIYQLYGSGHQFSPNDGYVEGFNSGEPYIGGVYYGNDLYGNELGASGHYADLGREEVREWWGTQYKYLYSMGLEMVWQDMTTPAIRDYRGDMKGFPFRLLLTDDSVSGVPPKLTPAIKVWNLYSYNLHKATYQGLNRLHELNDPKYPNLSERKNKRNFIIGRGSFSGAHRYSGLWNGDNSSDWDFLKMNVSQVLSLGLCGLAVNGQDIGGFEASVEDEGKWANPELLIRWTAAGAFLPWFRNHYVRKGRKEFQEPFMYEEWFNEYNGGILPEPQDLYRMVLPICKHYIELRYRLLQLFYDAMFENSLNGLPISRPLFINDPDDHALYNDKESFLDNEFFVGKDLLIAPVLNPEQPGLLHKNDGKRDVYVPSGSDWYCFMNNTKPLESPIEGGTTIRDFDAHLGLEGDHINFIVPIYVRAGAIIPTIELEQYVGQLNQEGKPNPITLNIYPGNSGEYTMFLDDGVSRSSAFKMPPGSGWDEEANDEYRKTKITHSYITQTTREIKIERIHDGYTPKFETYFFVVLLHDPSESVGNTGCLKSVKIAGQELPQTYVSDHVKESAQNTWYYNETFNGSVLKVFDDSPSITITVEYF